MGKTISEEERSFQGGEQNAKEVAKVEEEAHLVWTEMASIQTRLASEEIEAVSSLHENLRQAGGASRGAQRE